MMAWVLFRADDFTHAWGYFEAMFSYKSTNLNIDILHTFLNNEIYLVLVIAILSSTRIWVIIYNNALAMVSKNNSYLNIANGVWSFIVLIFVVGVMILSTNYLVVSSYNPFIYFRF
jgi:alginate O-acetyltransferase complex protein AlgI